MASAEHEPITGICGQRSPGVEALVEAESLSALKCPQEGHISRLMQVSETRCLFTHKLTRFFFCIAQLTMTIQ